MGDAAALDSPPAEESPRGTPTAEADDDGPTSVPTSVPTFTLEYPPLWVRGQRVHGPNPRLVAQLLGAVVALMTFAYMYIGVR